MLLRQSRAYSLFARAALAAAIALTLPSAAIAAAAASAPTAAAVNVTLNGDPYELKTAPYVADGTVYLPIRDIGELLGSVVFWNGQSKTVTMTYPKLAVRLRQGSMEATVNGKTVPLTAPLKTVNGRIYVPLRFFSESAGVGVEWKGSSRTVSLTRSDDYVMGGGVNVTLWLNRETGDLYYAHPYEQAPAHVGKVDATFKGHISMTVGGYATRSTVITILDNYGEPSVQFAAYGILVHEKKIVSQKKASYFQRYEPNLSYFQYYHPDGWIQNLALTDGRTVTVFNDEGEETAAYDLPSLVGLDESYAVLGMSDKYLVVRPNSTGFLTLINLDDGNSKVVLYEKLLSGQDLEYAKGNDVPYRGDSLMFAGGDWQGDRLTFWYDSPFDDKGRHYVELHYDRAVAGDNQE